MTQTSSSPSQQAPPPPSAPATQVVVGARIGDGATLAIPKTGEEVAALRQQREELSHQLENAATRRKELARTLRGMDDAARVGVEQRIALLDRRILNLESELDQTGQQLIAASPAVLALAQTGTPFDRLDPDAITAISVTFTMFVLAPIGLALSRFLWKRAAAPPRAPSQNADTTQRLDRIENAVESIAIEVERVSEGQRFLTRLFTEGRESSVAALGVGERPAEPIPVGEKVGQAR
ncbi:MAG TPA: hypothetical protein VFJ74_10280 [Gemmatimonadaceae bacterium]|nr:hypothetical protein [Gemmatimonadaceae bacterium]